MALQIARREREAFVVRPARHEVRFPTIVTHNAFVGTSHAQGVCTDINHYGVGADVSESLMVGEIVRLEIGFPCADFNSLARVIYRNEHHYGFYFVDTEPEQQELLALTLASIHSQSKLIQ